MQKTRPEDYALLLLRCMGLYLALGHGWGKFVAMVTGNGDWIVGMVGNLGFPLPALFAWALALAEFVGGLCVFIGFGTRFAAFSTGFAMFVAAFVRHGAMTRFLAWIGLSSATAEELQALGNPEMPLLYVLGFAALVVAGGGRITLATRLKSRRRR